MTHYRIYTPLHLWARMLVWGATFGLAASLLFAAPSGTSRGTGIGTALGLVALGLLIEVLLNGLTVELTASELQLHLGRIPVIRKRIPLREIEAFEAVTYRPLREFGGWGVRGFGRRQAWSARGNRAVRLQLEGGREIYVGVDEPRVLVDRLRIAIEGLG